MARKDNARNPLQLKLRARSLPRGVTPRKYFGALLNHIKYGAALPESWEVEVGWRNPKTRAGRTKRWQYDDFENAVADSREGFNALLYDAIARRFREAKR